jgi:hypothetical protein
MVGDVLHQEPNLRQSEDSLPPSRDQEQLCLKSARPDAVAPDAE